jgi:hypothetical protein
MEQFGHGCFWKPNFSNLVWVGKDSTSTNFTQSPQLSLILCHKLFVQSSTTIHHMSEKVQSNWLHFQKQKKHYLFTTYMYIESDP